MKVYRKITIIKIKKPTGTDPNEGLMWVGTTLGLFSIRDKDSSCYRVFIELLKYTKKGGLTSDDMAARLNLSRGTVIHHINRLTQSGLVASDGNKYVLRENNLKALLEELKKDIDNTYTDLVKVADEMDKWLGI